MTILGLRTDKPLAELYLYEDTKKIGEIRWKAHRELSNTIHLKIQELLNKSSISLEDVDGIVCFKGPGSFTGLRIGLTVANALAYARNIPIVAKKNDNWLDASIKELLVGHPPVGGDKIAMPYYDHPSITAPPQK